MQYCLQANCNQTSLLTFAEYSQAWDFRNTAVGQLQVDVYANSSKDPDVGNSAPLNLRTNQVSATVGIPLGSFPLIILRHLFWDVESRSTGKL